MRLPLKLAFLLLICSMSSPERKNGCSESQIFGLRLDLVTSNKMTNSSQRGFTLVELSIVLVIIGLIVSGVLVGQELIRGARTRAQVTQLQKFDTAIGAFTTLFAIPGGILGVSAWHRGMQKRLTSNGIIESDSTN